MLAHDVIPAGGLDEWRSMPDANPVTFTAALCGIAAWIGAAETAKRAVTAWSGITDELGAVVPVARANLEAMLLNEAFAEQVAGEIDRFALISLRPSPGAPS